MLTDAKVKSAKAADKDYKLGDGGQLYLLVTKSGGRLWRMNYTYGRNGKGLPAQKTLALGAYPAVGIAAARKARDDAKAQLSAGLDPAVERRVATLAQATANENTFETVARRWHAFKLPTWSTVHAKDVIDSLAADIFPAIGAVPITSLKAPRLLEILQKVEARGAIETAHRLRQRLSAIFVYGIAAGIAEADPAASLGKALRPVPKSKPQPSIIDRYRELDDQVRVTRQLLIDCEAERCRAQTKLAMRFLALTAVRSNELNNARWDEITGIDWARPDAAHERALWTISAQRMKGDLERKEETDGDHLVPLSRQAVDVLFVLRRLTGDLQLMFPSERHLHRPISENTLRALLIRAGYYQRHVPHGWRSAFSTIMNERADREWRAEGGRGAAPDRGIIDLMLAHIPDQTSGSEGAYNRAAYMARRRELAQEWADLLVGGMWEPDVHIGQPIRWAATGPGR
ncbi:tyrosine-type recombinase/integrase [Sphingomonas sanxanigenens]|uniref:Integrase n=1 Tax=Sphingomonas sanxanigenens DSM 19645 = NX02 TaxID=1123269 RepID=W0A7U6_9SPHN|nr:integrase arm-type DNA-binding domain-containing protein [Sphingomonas sanxanigenens]AHE51735.1 integrase [Sphingomonas sanxanigenens DSM 19645 = NX02]